MSHFRSCVWMLLAGVLLAGCGGGLPKTADKQIPAPKEPPAPPPAKNEPIDLALQTAARAELNTGLGSNDPFIRMHAIEAFQNGLGSQAKSVYLNGLKDTDPEVRFASAMAIGQLELADAKNDLVEMVNDANPMVRIAVRYALHRLGNTTYSKDLESLARDPDRSIRAEAARILGLLGEPTAVRVLKPMLRDREDGVRLQAAEALWRLGNEEGLRTLVASTTSGFPDDQMIALMGLAGPKDRRILGHLYGALTADYAEVGLVAARAMGICGSDAGYTIAAQAARGRDARQRVLAAHALGAIGRSDAQGYLADLLKDKESADVRLSAAQALLQLKAPSSSARGE